MEQRKEDIKHRLTRLKSEVLCAQTLLTQLLNSSIEIAASVENENDKEKFRRLYPVNIADLDSRLHHVINFNCLIESLIDIPNVVTNESNTPLLEGVEELVLLPAVNSIPECSYDVQTHPVKEEPQLKKTLNESSNSPTISQESDGKNDSPVPTPEVSLLATGDSSYESNDNVTTDDTLIQNNLLPPVVLCKSSADSVKEIILPPPIVGLHSNNKSRDTKTFSEDSLKALQDISSEVKCVSESSQISSTEVLPVVLQEPKRECSGVLENQAQTTLSTSKILATKQVPIKVPRPRMQNRKNQNVFTPKQAPYRSQTPFRSQMYNEIPGWKQNGPIGPVGQYRPVRNQPRGQCSTKSFQNIVATPKYTPGEASSIAKVPTVPSPIPIFADTLVSILHSKNEWFGLVAHAISPSEFYFHVSTADNDKIDDFHISLNEFYQNSARVTIQHKWEVQEKVGNFCACFFEGDSSAAVDRGWYRAQVLDWLPDTKDIVCLQLVDFGNKFKAKLADIQPLPKRFADRPVFATRCHLGYLRPPPPCKEWPQSTNAIFLKRLRLENLEISFMISPIGKADIPPFSTECNLNHSKSVPVILVPDDNSGSINDYLIEIAFAEFDSQMEIQQVEKMESNEREKEFAESKRKVEEWCMGEKVVVKPKRPARVPSPEFRLSVYDELEPKTNLPPPEDEMDSWDPMQEDFENAEVDDEDACVAVSGYAATDESRVCRFFAADGHCPWGNKCRREHVLANIHGITTDKEEVYGSAYNDMPMHPIGETISIQVTSAQGGYFYANEVIESSSHSASALEMLCDAINTRANMANLKRLRVLPALGQIVLAKFSEDGRFYRARVIDGGDGSVSVFVFFVDFGNWELVLEKDCREIEPKFMHLAFQAIRCSLANVLLDNKMHDEAASFFSVQFGPPMVLKAHVITSDASTLYVLATDEHNNDVGEAMISNGYGTFIDVSDVPHFNFKEGDMIPG